MAAAFTPACGGSQPNEPPAAPPPAPPPAMAPAAPVAATPPAAPPAGSAEAPPAAPPEKHEEHHHGMAALFISSLKSIDLKPEQKSVVDGIESDMEKMGDQHQEPGEKLASDIADGVAAGKIDHAKTDADIKALTKALEASAAGVQDAVNRLHKTLDPAQRKKFVETMREKGKDMREHGMMGPGDHEHGTMGPGDHEHGMMGKEGPGAHEHGMHGPADGEHGMHGPGGGEHGMAEHMGMLAEALGLSPEQKEKIRTKMEAQMKAKEAAMKARMAAAEKHMMAIGDAFETDKFDAKKVGVGTKAPEMAKEMATARITFVETVLAVLTPEQRTKFAAHVREHARDMHDD
jgi:protein CpxP